MTKIAVIEDDALVRNVYIRVLTGEGYEVVDFADAAPALETCNFEELDLIIADLEMPTPGEELIETVRRQGIQTPIIVVCGYLGQRSKQLKELGVQETLQKPIKLEELLNVIRELV